MSPPPITRTVTQVFPVKIVPEHLPLLFSGCKYGTKRLGDFLFLLFSKCYAFSANALLLLFLIILTSYFDLSNKYVYRYRTTFSFLQKTHRFLEWFLVIGRGDMCKILRTYTKIMASAISTELSRLTHT